MDITKQIENSELSDFSKRVYLCLLAVPKGNVTTYKALAEKAGTHGYRAIGMVMNRNPFSPAVPCHRVVANDGSLHGFAGELAEKEQMLHNEGVPVVNGKVPEKFILRCL
ncbi:MAG: MGMT family protein [Nanoarchaeota archaeon]